MKSFKLISVIAIMFSIYGARAFAHAHLQEAIPAQNSVVHQAPSEVRLKFSEDLETGLSKIEVKDVDSGILVSSGKSSNGGQDSNTLEVALKPLKKEKSKYRVTWKAVSKDSHKMQGAYEFTFDPKE
jgi:methionine-rich copper-binding protein CopC